MECPDSILSVKMLSGREVIFRNRFFIMVVYRERKQFLFVEKEP